MTNVFSHRFFCLLFLVIGASQLHSQAVTQGEIDYEVTMVYNKKSFQAGETNTRRFRVSFNNQYYRTEQLGDGPTNIIVKNLVTNIKRNFTDIFGYHFEITDLPDKTPNVKIVHRDETKMIQGYLCHRVIIQRPEGNFEAWGTSDIALKYPDYANICLLEYSIPTKNGMRVYKAVKVTGYEPITQAQLDLKLHEKSPNQETADSGAK
jgi:hypothetical protein